MQSVHGMGKVSVFLDDDNTYLSKVINTVLECSIVRKTDMEVNFTYMKDNYTKIPEYTNYTGLAIYLHSHSLVLSDIWDLWTKPRQLGTQNEGKLYSCADKVLLIDCSKCKDINLLNTKSIKLEDSWLSVDKLIRNHTKLLHFSEFKPWLEPFHPNSIPWQMEFSIAIHVGMLTHEVITKALEENTLHSDYKRFITTNNGKSSRIKHRELVKNE